MHIKCIDKHPLEAWNIWLCSLKLFLSFTSSDADTTDEEMVSAVLKYVSNYNVWIYMYLCLCDSLRVKNLFYSCSLT